MTDPDFAHDQNNKGGRIKGLKLRHFGKLNITYLGKLLRRSSSNVAPQ